MFYGYLCLKFCTHSSLPTAPEMQWPCRDDVLVKGSVTTTLGMCHPGRAAAWGGWRVCESWSFIPPSTGSALPWEEIPQACAAGPWGLWDPKGLQVLRSVISEITLFKTLCVCILQCSVLKSPPFKKEKCRKKKVKWSEVLGRSPRDL